MSTPSSKRVRRARRKAARAPRPSTLAPRKPKRPPGKPSGSTTCKKKRVKRRNGKSVKVRICRKSPRKPAATTTRQPLPLPPPAVPPSPDPAPDPGPVVVLGRPFTVTDAQRLLWRAGFGPRRGDAERLSALGLEAAVASLVHPAGAPQLIGPEAVDDDGNPLKPRETWAHDHCWWLDRMVRTDQPLIERMTLVWHDWFATSNDKVGSRAMVLDQNALLRRNALGSFRDLMRELTVDPAMLIWLDGLDSRRDDPNENFGREAMELFTLGAGRGAYTEIDVREAARAFTGWRATWVDPTGYENFRLDPARHDAGQKTIFGQTGTFGWEQVIDLLLAHPMHASFFVTKLWSYFIPVAPDAGTQAQLQQLYTTSGLQIAPVLQAILQHPALYDGPAMIKPPVVHQAGLMRTLGLTIDSTAWAWLGDDAGQMLFAPPNVAGWDDDAWLDTSRWRARWQTVAHALNGRTIDPYDDASPYPSAETPHEAVASALAWCGAPAISPELHAALVGFARDAIPPALPAWDQGPRRGLRQNALRMLVLSSSDLQAC